MVCSTLDECLADMECVMLLLLGCAVQGESKAHHIDVITSLDVTTQQAIVQWIRKVRSSYKELIASSNTI